MPRTPWSLHFSHTQNAEPGITLNTERKTELKGKQRPRRSLPVSSSLSFTGGRAQIVLMFKFSFSPGCTENSSLTLGAIFVLLFSFSIAFDWKQWCFKESYLDKTEPCPMPLMMEAQALLWERQVQSREEERQALDPPHPCAACSQSSSPLPSSDMPTAAFSSRLVKCPSPRQGTQM